MKRIIFIVLGLVFLFGSMSAYGDARDDFVDSLQGRQQAVSDAYDKLDTRIKAMSSNDDRKDHAKELLKTAKDRVDDFKDLDASEEAQGGTFNNPLHASDSFLRIELEALEAINDVNVYLFSPSRPGGEGDRKGVPTGDLIDDFIPQAVRLLFRFTSVVILIVFIVSAIMFITSMDNEEQHTKARHMLIFALVGFAFVVMAFAIVKAITDIDFFAFI